MSTIDANSLSIDLADELGEILQTELVHILVPEIHDSVRVGRLKHLTRQDRMPQELSQDLWRRENVLAKLQQGLLDRVEVFKAVLGVLMEQVDQDLAHLVGQDSVLDKVRLLVDVVLG